MLLVPINMIALKSPFPRNACDMWHSCVGLLIQNLYLSHPIYNYVMIFKKIYYTLIMHHVYYASMFFITSKWITFVKDAFSTFMIFKVKNKFEPKVFKCVVKMDFTNLKFSVSFNHQYKYPFQFREGMVDIWKKKITEKIHSKVLSVYNHFWNIINLHQILSIESLQIMELISEKKFDDPNYCVPLWIFKNKKIYNFKQCPPTY